MASHGGMLLSVYANTKEFKLNNVTCYNKLDGMENAIVFTFTLLGLELSRIKGLKAGSLFTPSLRIYYVEFNIMMHIQFFTYIHLNSTENIGAKVPYPDN